MFGEQLVDLDELVLRCRDDQARQYIAEAVACYKVGAFRSSIVSTWIAIIFDFIYKLRELELTGDTKASNRLEEFEKIRRNSDVTGSLNFEKKILDLAKDEFQLLSPLEYADLSRLLTDRNRCAHPSMNSIEDIYQPSAELVRYHLHNAVSYLLQRPPVQGKAAIKWLLNEIDSEYFPISDQEAAKSFANGPLRRPADALVRNFIIVLIKALLSDDLDEQKEQRYYVAINAVRKIHRELVEKTFSTKLNDIFKGVPDSRFGLIMRFLYFISDTWQYTHEDIRIKINEYITHMDSKDLVPNLLVALQIGSLHIQGMKRLADVSVSELAEIIAADTKNELTNEFVDIAISWYEDAGNYASANSIGSYLIVPLVEALSLDQIERIIKIGNINDQVSGSYQFLAILEAILKNEKVDKAQMITLLKEHDLEDYIEHVFPEQEETLEEDEIPF